MYIYPDEHEALGRELASPRSLPPKASATDAQVLRRATKLAGSIHTTIEQVEQSMPYLATSAQRDLFKEMIVILAVFFPKGYGVVSKGGKVIKSSKRYRKEVIRPLDDVPFYFHHDTWLFLSYQKSNMAGMHRPFAPGHRNWIYLYVQNLTGPSLARTLIHEMVHMLSHRYRSIEAKFGTRVASGIPTSAAGMLLNRSSFGPMRRAMEQHFLKLVDFLNRRPHRARGGYLTGLSNIEVATWGAHLIEEVLTFVVKERATLALAKYQARKTGIGLSQQLVPMQFLKQYLRNYWLSDPEDTAALKTKDADRLFQTMEVDLLKLVSMVEKHVGP